MIFLESPWPILSLGIAVEVALVIALLITRRGALLWWMLGAAAFVLLGWLIQWLVVTDREAIDNAVRDCAAAVEANDIDRLLNNISPSSQKVRADARLLLEAVEVEMVRLLDLQIEVDRRSKPRTAKAVIKAIGRGRDRKGQIPINTCGCKAIVSFCCDAGRWFVVDYRLEELELPGARGQGAGN